jgi:hypothetical protein
MVIAKEGLKEPPYLYMYREKLSCQVGAFQYIYAKFVLYLFCSNTFVQFRLFIEVNSYRMPNT